MNNDLLDRLRRHIKSFKSDVNLSIHDEVLDIDTDDTSTIPITKLLILKSQLEIIIDLYRAIRVAEETSK